jgi:arginyl-tRNA synthetase
VSAVLQALEAHDPAWEKRWLETRDACLKQIDAIFKELDIHFARTYLESEVEAPGKALVTELLDKGIAKEGDKGAIIVDLEDEKLGIFLALKSDGTALYSTKELALAQLKFKEYPGTNESLHVVDNRQSLYFKQFFAVLRRMGFTQPMRHLSHDFVTLAEGAMSSRKGNIVTYEDFRDEMTERVLEETKKRHEDWSPEKQKENAWAIAEGAMKFGMLKQDDDRPIVFDMTAALSFDGFTGPYVQYSHARLSSILSKAGGEVVSVCKASDDPKEFALLRLVAEFPGVVSAAAAAYRPSLIAQYAFDLAQEANAFYRDVPVLSAEADERCRRLAIVEAARKTLARALWLLGIKAPEEM